MNTLCRCVALGAPTTQVSLYPSLEMSSEHTRLSCALRKFSFATLEVNRDLMESFAVAHYQQTREMRMENVGCRRLYGEEG